MIFQFKNKWYIFVFPFQVLDIGSLVSPGSRMEVEYIRICKYGTLAGVKNGVISSLRKTIITGSSVSKIKNIKIDHE